MTRAADFWSRRKAKVQDEEHAAQRAEDARIAALQEAEQAGKSDAELLEELGLPDPDTLGSGADFKAFMAKAVPDRIRRRALRRLWTSNPALANLDGLLDYGEDFTDSAKVLENMQTAYQVGKGMMAHVEELARQAEAAEAADADPEAGAGSDTQPETESAPETRPEPLIAQHDAPDPAHGDRDSAAFAPEAGFESDADTETAPPRRRMRFSFGTSRGAEA
ncbi:MAG: DUF3306 domain-containing protein [Pseudomonadota bacterium]|uniref:DUF3306 domain-containing protein n=1 Tax=Roseovarius TaxID=74030 RepID=UPI0022A86B5A|nr:DUF3306 domain-containing protein [Roseovarius sp. EGI FJ00037]MCZ0812709.1 DUF3306 domain-containing protein [Roseovarius sp. EGI FJ00037]